MAEQFQVQRELGKLSADVSNVKDDVKDIREDMDIMKDDISAMRSAFDQAKGGARVMMGIAGLAGGGVASGIALVMKLWGKG